MRSRFAAVSAVALSLAALLSAGQALAAAEVHRFNFVLSAIPTSVDGGDFNKALDWYNLTQLEPNGLKNMDHVSFTWAYDAELRYFVRPNFAVSAGLTHLLASQKKEYLPAIGQTNDVTAKILTVPVHVGFAYYLQPYNQGDFQARAFLGAGLEQYTYTRASFEQANVGNSTILPGSYNYSLTQDAPGYYLELGSHMFFASTWSVLISALYRNGKLRDADYDAFTTDGKSTVVSANPVLPGHGHAFDVDVSGAGVRFAVAKGF